MKTTVIHHSADYDGIFCREIARLFLPEAELIGWDFKDPPLQVPTEGRIIVMDLPLDVTFGAMPGGLNLGLMERALIWIDHHKTAIDSHPKDIPGYRIDGVAACRLAWQWFVYQRDGGKDSFGTNYDLPTKQHFVDRIVGEPLAVRLAGEYDIWDHRGDGDLELQFGLGVAGDKLDWSKLLDPTLEGVEYLAPIVNNGLAAMTYSQNVDASMTRNQSFLIEWEGLKFLALNTGRFNSQTFDALDVHETGHDALMGFNWNGKKWTFSLYHAAHRKDLDLSEIAKRHGGGGHRGACGFTAATLPIAL